MIYLTSNIAVPNIARLRVIRVEFDDANSVAVVTVEARSAVGANRLYGQFRLPVVNGNGTPSNTSHRLKLNAAPAGYGDALVVDMNVEIANGFANLDTAYRGAGGRAAAYRAAEQQGLTDGWTDSTLAGTVS